MPKFRKGVRYRLMCASAGDWYAIPDSKVDADKWSDWLFHLQNEDAPYAGHDYAKYRLLCDSPEFMLVTDPEEML